LRPDDRPRLGAERTLPAPLERLALLDPREGAERTAGALDRDGLETRGARLTGARFEELRPYEPLRRVERCGVDARDRDVDGARLTREEPELRDGVVTRLLDRCCGIVAREREPDRSTRDELLTRLLDRCGVVDRERSTREVPDERLGEVLRTRLLDRCGVVAVVREPERTVDVPFVRERELGCVTVVRLVRCVVRVRSPSVRQPPERVVVCEPLRTAGVCLRAVVFDRLTDVAPAAPPRTVERVGDCAPVMLPRTPEFVDRTVPPLRVWSSRKLRTELTTC